MNRKQRITLIVGVVLFLAAVVCPPWSYYGGELRLWRSSERVSGERTPVPVGHHQDAEQAWLQYNAGLVHSIRGLAILAIFAVTVILYLKFASAPGDEAERPGRPTRVFWIVFAAIALLLLAIPFWILLVYLTRLARG